MSSIFDDVQSIWRKHRRKVDMIVHRGEVQWQDYLNTTPSVFQKATKLWKITNETVEETMSVSEALAKR